jgi:fused signal recognition particle receptor
MSAFFDKWKSGLTRTRNSAIGRLASTFGASEITPDTWDELESVFIQADMGIDTTQSILTSLKNKTVELGVIKTRDFFPLVREELLSRLDRPVEFNPQAHHPEIILFVGVNGSGKTTTAAKLGSLYQKSGIKVLLAAADTYRAAAIDQLEEWGTRLNIPVISGQPNSDPGAVAYDSVQAALSRNVDLLIIDTAGRLHTRYNLMEEIKKVHRVIGKSLENAPHEVWLVLDAATGQNAFQQAKYFKEAVKVTGIILTKMDTSSHGGMVFAIQEKLAIPVIYIGMGEQPDDLLPFDPESFVDGLLSDLKVEV